MDVFSGCFAAVVLLLLVDTWLPSLVVSVNDFGGVVLMCRLACFWSFGMARWVVWGSTSLLWSLSCMSVGHLFVSSFHFFSSVFLCFLFTCVAQLLLGMHQVMYVNYSLLNEICAKSRSLKKKSCPAHCPVPLLLFSSFVVRLLVSPAEGVPCKTAEILMKRK